MVTTTNPTAADEASHSSTFTLRKGRLSDIHSIAQVGQAAFSNDQLFELFMPNNAGTNKIYKYMYYRNLARMLNPKLAFVVAEDIATKRVVGFVSFERYGEGGGQMLDYGRGGWGYVGHPYVQRVEAKLLEWQKRWGNTMPKDMNQEAMERFAECERMSAREHYAVYPERWHTQLLAVDPEYSRRGVGRALIRYAIKWAEEEGNGVVVTLEASVQGAPLYKRLGFREIGRWDIPEGGSPVMVYVPDEHKDANGNFETIKS